MRYYFIEQGLLPPWLNLFLHIFISFDVTINEVVSLISLSNTKLLVPYCSNEHSLEDFILNKSKIVIY